MPLYKKIISLTIIRYERRNYMRIRFMAVPLLLLSLLCAACQQGEEKASGPSIAVVDIVRVMRDSEAGKAGISYLEDMQAGIQKQLDDIQTKLEKDPENEQLQKQLQSRRQNRSRHGSFFICGPFSGRRRSGPRSAPRPGAHTHPAGPR